MATLIWIISFFFIKTTFANICENICSCVDKTADCMNRGLKTQFDDNIWNNTKDITIVQLNGNEITQIHLFPQLPIEYLSLKNNSISIIEEGSFKLMANLTTLDLSMNLLHSNELMPDVFKGLYSPKAYEPLKRLKTLFLSSNKLHTLHADIFEHLPQLESLSIDNNPFKIIDTATVIALSSVPNLKVLDLSKTQLKTLPDHMFNSFRLLSVLNLSDNKFETIPEAIKSTHNLKKIILDGNPIKIIENFPSLPSLEILHMNWMPSLTTIRPDALSNLTGLKELTITQNLQLTEIFSTALSRMPNDGSEGRVWPELKRLHLQNNKLRYLERNLIAQWDLLDVIDIRGNPWVCDCKNQWMVSVLIPKIKTLENHLEQGIVCDEPIEMRGLSMQTLEEKQYHMRCLDAYGNRPEKDGVLLIGVVIGLLLAIPFTMAALIVYRRRNTRPKMNFPHAFYKRADSTQPFVDDYSH